METWLIVLLVVIALIVIASAVILIVVLKKKKKSHIKVDDEFIDGLIEVLGGKDNISEVLVDNARLKIKVNDVKKPQFEELKKIASQGVFITGSYVKVLFKYDSNQIKKAIDRKL